MLSFPIMCLILLFPPLAQPAVTLDPYPLPAKVLADLDKLGGESDVLILGEVHGTQEVPGVAAALLAPLSKRGYGVLALEIPTDQQRPLMDWATGKTETIPSFFAKPFPDGRGSIQALSLIRTALAPPFRWQLICFDASLAEMAGDIARLSNQKANEDDLLAFSVRRDENMARNLARARTGEAKVLVICGGLHARTFNPALKENAGGDNTLRKLWPSFAAALARGNPTWKVRSINVRLHGGGFYAMVAEGSKPPVGKVNTIPSNGKLKEAEAHALQEREWDWELNLPKATPATFLATPTP